MSLSSLKYKPNDSPHIIIVAYHVLPFTKLWGAAQRMHYLSEHLIENNYDVTIMGADFGTSNYSGKKLNYRSIGIKIKPTLIQKYQETFQRSNSDLKVSINKNQSFNFTGIIKRLLKPLYLFFEKLFFNDFAYYGFLSYFWELSARKKVLKEIKLNNTKTVIISGPYFGVFKISKAIKRTNEGIKIILDYRDPWNLLKKGSFVSKLKEKTYLSLADQVVMFSDRFKDDMMKKFSLPEDKCLTVYNGYDSDLWDKIEEEFKNNDIRKNKDKFIISYISSNISFKKGTPRDPRNLIKAVSNMNNSNKVLLNIIGCIDTPNNNEFSNYDFDLNLSLFVTHEKALKIMNESDIVVILSTEKTDSKYTLTGKLFDCIRSGKFILGIANSEDVNYCTMIDKLDIGKSCVNEINEISNILEIQYRTWSKENRKHSKFNKEIYSRRNQNIKLIKKINNLYK